MSAPCAREERKEKKTGGCGCQRAGRHRAIRTRPAEPDHMVIGEGSSPASWVLQLGSSLKRERTVASVGSVLCSIDAALMRATKSGQVTSLHIIVAL
jgi:hypothetical protein